VLADPSRFLFLSFLPSTDPRVQRPTNPRSSRPQNAARRVSVVSVYAQHRLLRDILTNPHSAYQPFPILPSILLLIHLHLLECPLTTDPACEPQMFDPACRSLVERVNFAEEIIYFLTKRAESEAVAKSVGDYPLMA
jgi:hypothetical protein